MKQEIIKIIRRFHLTNEIKTYDQCAEEILRLFSVVGQSEKLKCQCKKAKFTRTVDADFTPLCGRCGKAL